VRDLLELLITIQLLTGNGPCRGSLQKENAQIDRVVSHLISVYICRPCTPNISDNVLPFTPRSTKWSISLNYLTCSLCKYIYIFTFCMISTYTYSQWLYLGWFTNYKSVYYVISSSIPIVLLGAPLGVLYSDTLKHLPYVERSVSCSYAYVQKNR